jgi:predicted permease
MNNQIIVEHNYPLYIFIWLAAVIFVHFFFRYMYRKIKNTEDRATANSLFTVTVFIGVPVIISVIIGPIVFIIGDSAMDSGYRIIWTAMMIIISIYYLYRQSASKSKRRD